MRPCRGRRWRQSSGPPVVCGQRCFSVQRGRWGGKYQICHVVRDGLLVENVAGHLPYLQSQALTLSEFRCHEKLAHRDALDQVLEPLGGEFGIGVCYNSAYHGCAVRPGNDHPALGEYTLDVAVVDAADADGGNIVSGVLDCFHDLPNAEGADDLLGVCLSADGQFFCPR